MIIGHGSEGRATAQTAGMEVVICTVINSPRFTGA